MKTRMILMIMICLGISLCARNKVHQKSKAHTGHKSKRIFINRRLATVDNMNRMNRFKKEVKVNMTITKKSQEFLDRQAKASQAGNEIYEGNKAGRYDITKPEDLLVATGRLYMRVIQKSIVGDNKSGFEELQYKLNINSLYFMSQDDDLRGVLYGLNLMDIPVKQDNIKRAQCCVRIEPAIKHVEIALYNFQGFCFRIELQQEQWLLCTKKQKEISEFKALLQRQVIASYYMINYPGEAVPQQISSKGCEDVEFDWTEISQVAWPCMCNKGANQSPVTIYAQQRTQIFDRFIAPAFEPTSSVRYGKVVQEPEFYGDFGKWTYITPEDNLIYQTEKITFKIGKVEHPLIDTEKKWSKESEAEIHIHSKSSSGKTAIIAVHLVVDKKNEFLDQMNIPTWEENPNDSITSLRCLNQNSNKDFNLRDLFKNENAVIYTQKTQKTTTFLWDYYKYEGSLTKPPCDEGVEWFILENKISIDQTQLDNLRKYGLNKFTINPDNIRTPQPVGDRIIEYYQAEVCANQKEPPADPAGKYNYIKASKAYTIYGLADADANISEVFQNYSGSGNSKQIKIGDDPTKPDIELDFSTAGENSNKQLVPEQNMRILIDKYNKAKMGGNFDTKSFLSNVGASFGG